MSEAKQLKLTLHIWRQPDAKSPGAFTTYEVAGVSTHASFLEMLDILNEQLVAKGEEPVAFDHDCREGICGMCSLMINGRPHGGQQATTTCQLHMRFFNDGDEIWIEPWRAAAFPVIKDLCVDRRAFDRVIAAGGFITANVGSAPDANDDPRAEGIGRRARWMPPRASAAARASPRARTARRCCSSPRSCRTCTTCRRAKRERAHRTEAMVTAMDAAGFGNCSNHYECEAACPKDIRAT